MFRPQAWAMSLAIVLIMSLSSHAQFADLVGTFNPGLNAGVLNPSALLGGPQGEGINGGSLDVQSLGIGGSVVLGFNQPIVNGKGVDFTVFENCFTWPTNFAWAETAFVEVSSDGLEWVRFPVYYRGPAGPLPSWTTVPYGSYEGLTGGMPVQANVLLGGPISPFDPVHSGGESFDLEDLSLDAKVVAGLVDLNSINFMRLVDVVGGVDMDTKGVLIEDCWGDPTTDSGADIDGVAVINDASTAVAGQPTAEFYIDNFGHLHIRFSDPDGVQDLNPLSFKGSYNLATFTPQDFLSFYLPFAYDANTADYILPFPVVGTGVLGVINVSIADQSGNVAYDQFYLPG